MGPTEGNDETPTIVVDKSVMAPLYADQLPSVGFQQPAQFPEPH